MNFKKTIDLLNSIKESSLISSINIPSFYLFSSEIRSKCLKKRIELSIIQFNFDKLSLSETLKKFDEFKKLGITKINGMDYSTAYFKILNTKL